MSLCKVNATYLHVRFSGHDSVVNCSACGYATCLVTWMFGGHTNDVVLADRELSLTDIAV